MVYSVEKVSIDHIVTNAFYKKFLKNGKIILFDGGGRGTSSLDLASCWKLMEDLESPSC